MIKFLLYLLIGIVLAIADVTAFDNWEFWVILICVIAIDFIAQDEYRN